MVINRKQLEQKIQQMKYPSQEGQVYFEYDSADGFAFLAAAKGLLGLNCEYELQQMQIRNYCLNAPNHIGSIEVPKENQYIYTRWTCCEAVVQPEHWEIIDKIGTYDDIGMMRYCTEEVHLVVPNVTSAAALIYCWMGLEDRAKALLDIFARNQDRNGNWNYYARKDAKSEWKIVRQEDCYHVAMIIYHLREIEKVSGIETAGMYHRALRWLLAEKSRCDICKKTEGWFCEGSIGWGVPMMTLAISGLGKTDLSCKRLEKQGIELTWQCLDHANFRVRSMAAWVFSKLQVS